MNCGNYRAIKLMCHSMKLYERVHGNRLRNIVSISEEQFGFVKGKSTTDAIFALRHLQEIYRKGQQDLHCVFIDLEKNIRQSPREECDIDACETRVCQRSTSEWRRTCTITAKL